MAAIFVTCLVISNIVAVKLIAVGGLILPAAIVIFPVSYLLADVLTEVYGFRAARRVIWSALCSPARGHRHLHRRRPAGGRVLVEPAGL